MVLKYVKDRIQGKAPAGAMRSTRWPTIRAIHLKTHGCCEVCGSRTQLEVHHIIPFHNNPDLELDATNLITLCESKKYGLTCHLLMGHLGNYRHSNPAVIEDVRIWRAKLSLF